MEYKAISTPPVDPDLFLTFLEHHRVDLEDFRFFYKFLNLFFRTDGLNSNLTKTDLTIKLVKYFKD